MNARVPLNRALSKLGMLSRAEATAAVLAGRVRVSGRIVRHPTRLVVVEGLRVTIDDNPRARPAWRTILFHKPRGVVTTRRDPEGRRTVFDVVGEAADGLVAVGRLDLATSGLLLLTTDTELSARMTDPAVAVPRLYVVTARGNVTQEDLARLTSGIGELKASAASVRKASARESHLIVELSEGKNREVRRLFNAIGHEVSRLKRVRFGGLELGTLEPGRWRDVSRDEIAAAFPGCCVSISHATSQADGSRTAPTPRKTARATRRSLR